LVQTLLQSMPSLKQLQTPAWQVVPVLQMRPQPPQLPLSSCSLTQAVPQVVEPAGQPQTPPVQD
jgi:hypothetical protein